MAQSKTSFRLEFYSIAFALKQIRISGVLRNNNMKTATRERVAVSAPCFSKTPAAY